MTIVPCDCPKKSKVFIRRRSLTSDRWHIDYEGSVWCCVQDKDTGEYLRTVLISESPQKTEERETWQAEVDATDDAYDKKISWEASKEYCLICDEIDITLPSYARTGSMLSFDPSHVPEGLTITFSAILESSNGDAQAVLYNVSDDVEVSQSELVVSDSGPALVSVTLSPDAEFPNEEKLYEVRLKKTAGAVAAVKRAGIEVKL